MRRVGVRLDRILDLEVLCVDFLAVRLLDGGAEVGVEVRVHVWVEAGVYGRLDRGARLGFDDVDRRGLCRDQVRLRELGRSETIGMLHALLDGVVEEVPTVHPLPAAEERVVEHLLLHLDLSHLGPECGQRLPQFLSGARPGDVGHLLVEVVRRRSDLALQLLALVVQLLHRVDQLP